MSRDPIERVLRAAYSVVLVVLLPITLYHLVWRGFRQPAYFQRWGERYARYPTTVSPAPIWVHAVSVGEVNAIAPLVQKLLDRTDAQRIVITTITPTGSARVKALWGDRVEHVYLPYDLKRFMRRFLAHFNPSVGLIVETELWPNMLFACRDGAVPVCILNARLSARSLRGYQVLDALVRRALATVSRVCAQSRMDGERFLHLGARRDAVVVTGNLKFDVNPPENADALRQIFLHHAGQRPVWIAASTHADEETIVISAHRKLRQRWPDALLIWAPRHPERFKSVAEQARAQGLRVSTRSANEWPEQKDAVFVLDTLGELGRFYAAADVAFVGGSLQPIGGHNMLEPAIIGTPIITGPHLFNFSDISQRMREADAMIVADDVAGFEAALMRLFASPEERTRMKNAAHALVVQGRGALANTLEAITSFLPSRS